MYSLSSMQHARFPRWLFTSLRNFDVVRFDLVTPHSSIPLLPRSHIILFLFLSVVPFVTFILYICLCARWKLLHLIITSLDSVSFLTTLSCSLSPYYWHCFSPPLTFRVLLNMILPFTSFPYSRTHHPAHWVANCHELGNLNSYSPIIRRSRKSNIIDCAHSVSLAFRVILIFRLPGLPVYGDSCS
jgi:hypothetical protein